MAELEMETPLDIRIAAEVMEWPDATSWGTAEYMGDPQPHKFWSVTPEGTLNTHHGRKWSPSTSIADAFEVVDKLTSTTKQWFELVMHSTGVEVHFEVSGDGDADFQVSAEAPAAPEAICLAALKAVGAVDA